MRFMRWISLLGIAGSLAIGLSTAQAASTQQQAVGEICVRAFNDINGDGTYTSPDEPLLGNVTFILSNETGRLGSYKTDGTEVEAYCFGNLAVGQYTVQARPDVNKVKGKPTTPGQWVVPLVALAILSTALVLAYRVVTGAFAAEKEPAAAPEHQENFAFYRVGEQEAMKTIEDALEIRRRILLAYEAAEREPDPARRFHHFPSSSDRREDCGAEHDAILAVRACLGAVARNRGRVLPVRRRRWRGSLITVR